MYQDKQPKYLEIYTGVVTGSFAGRDDGHPETKLVVYHSIDDLAKHYDKRRDQQYYKLVPVDPNELKQKITESLKQQTKKAKEKKRKSIEEQIAKLQQELKRLS